jgi:predicted dehydrogenase/nucleoside-diphosphate-sugar epimerase
VQGTLPLEAPVTTAPRRPAPGQATKVALVGAGYIADTHLEALRETAEVEVAAVCDVALEKAQSMARRHGIPHAVAKLEELPALGIEAVHLCVPPDLHVRLARAALELGLSVFVEKPLALATRDAEELAELARARGLVLGANHNSTYHPAFLRLLARVRSGAIGKLEHVDVHLSVPLRQLDARDYSHWMFREPKNIVFEQAVHPFAQVVQLLGRPLALTPTVLATRELRAGQPFHERWAIAARAEGGTAQFHFAFGATFQRATLTVRGSDGMVEADLHRNLVSEERKTLWLDFWDAYLAGARRGRALLRGARAGLMQYLRQTLRLAPRGDAFYAGMRGSIRAFHAAYRAGTAPSGDACEVAAVLEWCEATVRELAPVRPSTPLPFDPRSARPGEVVVLGANGFIGKPTLRALLARGLPVTAAVRRTQGLSGDLEAAARDGRLRLVRADLSDAATMASAVAGAKVVVHLATGGGSSWEEVQRTMVAGTRALAEACAAAKVERLVYVSSIAALYLGPDCGASVIEDSDGLDPEPAARPPYARGKAAAEKELLEVAKKRGLAVTIARPGVVLGAETAFQHSGIGLWVRDNHCVGWGHGNRPLPLVHVEDVADALARLAAFQGRELDGKALNLAARVPLTAAELVRAYAGRTGRDVHFHARALWFSQALEIGKWLVKKAGGRRDAFPSYRDLKSRSLYPAFSARLARETLGWKPCDDAREFLRRLFGDEPR